MNDDLLNYLVATDTLDEFSGNNQLSNNDDILDCEDEDENEDIDED